MPFTANRSTIYMTRMSKKGEIKGVYPHSHVAKKSKFRPETESGNLEPITRTVKAIMRVKLENQGAGVFFIPLIKDCSHNR